jgi:uncharacterized caspase-like protein
MKKIVFFFCCFSCSLLYAQTEGKIYAVIVGVSEYRQAANNLNYAHQDATDMYNLLKLQTATTNLQLLTNKQATKEQVIQVTKELFAKSRPEDVIIFYFSGHGNVDRFFVHDTDIKSKAVQELFKEAKAQRKLIFADACLSGTFRASGSSPATSSGRNTDQRVLLFLSSRSDQISRESPSLHNGAFTFFLIAGLKGGADANRDRMITAKELYDFVRPQVEEQTGGKQIPVMWGKFEDDMVIMNWKNN